MDKQGFVELIIDDLVGGDAPLDVRGKYHPVIVEEWIGLALAGMIEEARLNGSMVSLSALAQEYGYAPEIPIALNSTTGKYEAELPVSPLGGTEVIYSISGEGGCEMSIMSPGQQSKTMNYLKDCGDRATLKGKRLVFNRQPKSTKVFLEMIPSISELDDDAEFNVPGSYRARIVELIRSFMQVRGQKKEDVSNNQVADGR